MPDPSRFVVGLMPPERVIRSDPKNLTTATHCDLFQLSTGIRPPIVEDVIANPGLVHGNTPLAALSKSWFRHELDLRNLGRHRIPASCPGQANLFGLAIGFRINRSPAGALRRVPSVVCVVIVEPVPRLQGSAYPNLEGTVPSQLIDRSTVRPKIIGTVLRPELPVAAGTYRLVVVKLAPVSACVGPPIVPGIEAPHLALRRQSAVTMSAGLILNRLGNTTPAGLPRRLIARPRVVPPKCIA